MNVWWRVREEGRGSEYLVESEIRGQGELLSGGE